MKPASAGAQAQVRVQGVVSCSFTYSRGHAANANGCRRSLQPGGDGMEDWWTYLPALARRGKEPDGYRGT